MTTRAAYRTDLAAINLAEGSNTSWVQALKGGSYKHPIFGEILLDEQRARNFVANHQSNVRGVQLDIDFDHKAQRFDAAGWVVATEARGSDVWYQVEFTDEAASKIRAKQYKYFSAEFADEWTNPETGVTYHDVLFGGALTNRPFIKGMVPVNLSESEVEFVRERPLEFTEEQPAPTGDGGATEGGTVPNVALEAIRVALKLSEGTSEGDIAAAVLAKLSESAPPAPPADQDLKALAEDNPVIARLLADREADRLRFAEIETALTLSEVRRTLSEVDQGTALAVTPAVKGLAEKLLLKLNAGGREELRAILRHFAEEKGTVRLGEAGGTDPTVHTDGVGTDVVTLFKEKVDALKRDRQLSDREAIRVAQTTYPTLFSQYYEAATSQMRG